MSMSPFHSVMSAIFIHSRTADAFSPCDYLMHGGQTLRSKEALKVALRRVTLFEL